MSAFTTAGVREARPRACDLRAGDYLPEHGGAVVAYVVTERANPAARRRSRRDVAWIETRDGRDIALGALERVRVLRLRRLAAHIVAAREAYAGARDAWEYARDFACHGYAAELEAYPREHPAPRFADYLREAAAALRPCELEQWRRARDVWQLAGDAWRRARGAYAGAVARLVAPGARQARRAPVLPACELAAAPSAARGDVAGWTCPDGSAPGATGRLLPGGSAGGREARRAANRLELGDACTSQRSKAQLFTCAPQPFTCVLQPFYL